MEKVTVIFGRTEKNYSAYIEGLDCFVCASETFEELKKDVAEGIAFHKALTRTTSQSPKYSAANKNWNLSGTCSA